MHFKLVILDCDKTLWDHEDVSAMSPPFIKISKNSLIDSKGSKLTLHEGVRKFLKFAKVNKIMLSIASWNIKERAMEALDLLGISKYFDCIIIEYHPMKEWMVLKILNESKKLGLKFKEDEILFIDDSEEMLIRVHKRFPKIITLCYGKDIKNFLELIELLKRRLSSFQFTSGEEYK